MNNAFLEWLITAPSPWDCLATAAAVGALLVSFLERRDKRLDLEPIFEPTVWQGDNNWVFAKVKIRNNYAHGLRIETVTLLKPRTGYLTIKREQTPDGGEGNYIDPTDRVVKVGSDLKPAGESASTVGRLTFGYGDTMRLSFAVKFPEGPPPSITFAIEIREKLAGRRARTVKMTSEVEPAKG